MFFIVVDDLSKLISSFFLSLQLSLLFSLRQILVQFSIFLMLLLAININVLTAAWIYVVAVLLGLSVNFFFLFRTFNFFSYKSMITKKLIKKLFSFGTPLIIRDFSNIFLTRVDNLVLIYFRPLTEVAIYNVIVPTVEFLGIFSKPFGSLMFPLSSELSTLNQNNRIIFLLKMIHKYILVVVVPLGIGIFFFSEFILGTLFGIDYVSGSFGLRLLTIGFFMVGLNIVSSSVLMGLGKSKEVAKVTISRNFVNLFLNLLLIPLFGLYNMGFLGAIVSTVFCFGFSFFYFIYYLHKFLSYLPPLKEFFFIFISGLLSSTISYVMINNFSNIYVKIGVVFIAILISYPIFLFMFDVISMKEIKKIMKILVNKTKDKKQELNR